MSTKPRFEWIRELATTGQAADVDAMMAILTGDIDLPTTKAVDLYLGFVGSPSGISRIEHYLFHGSQIQRNYCTLFFARRNDWQLVNRAFNLGLIDEIQAYAR